MPGYRKPSYGAAINMAKLVYTLTSERRSMRLEDVLDMLEVSERTARRYLKIINDRLSFSSGEPLIHVNRIGEVERWVLNDEQVSATHFQLMSLFMGSILMSFLDKTVIHAGLVDVLVTAWLINAVCFYFRTSISWCFLAIRESILEVSWLRKEEIVFCSSSEGNRKMPSSRPQLIGQRGLPGAAR